MAEPGWEQNRLWRAETRKALLARRMALPAAERKERGQRAKDRLLAAVDWSPTAVLGIYWPIKGEIDVLDIARQHIQAGGIVALPVVTQKNAAVEFWRWDPLAKMERGFWNIPVPAIAERMHPDVLIIPLVGFDAAGYRLGYGGGYYDRTLSRLSPEPLRIGFGYAEASLATIHPQAHDIPMNYIVTDEAARKVFIAPAGNSNQARVDPLLMMAIALGVLLLTFAALMTS